MGIKRLGFIACTWSAILLFDGCADSPDRKVTPVEKVTPAKTKIEIVPTPTFSGESAYNFVQKQVDFGPRVPNSAAHKAGAKWLSDQLESYDLETIVQTGTVTAYNGDKLAISNIIGRFNPENPNRILLAAHWDSRPYADRGKKNRTKPIDGANDGASGVAVLLEIARIIQTDPNKPSIGFDIIFFDAEDYGKPESSMVGQGNNSWCLGSQYFSNNPPMEDYAPRYGILLDMVGAKDAVFPKEGASLQIAPDVVKKVWDIGRAMGHTDKFINLGSNPITDDHIYLSSMAKIPTIDIIHYEMARSDFGPFHHTHDDNMDIIDAQTLGAVGEVVTQVLYQER